MEGEDEDEAMCGGTSGSGGSGCKFVACSHSATFWIQNSSDENVGVLVNKLITDRKGR